LQRPPAPRVGPDPGPYLHLPARARRHPVRTLRPLPRLLHRPRPARPRLPPPRLRDLFRDRRRRVVPVHLSAHRVVRPPVGTGYRHRAVGRPGRLCCVCRRAGDGVGTRSKKAVTLRLVGWSSGTFCKRGGILRALPRRLLPSLHLFEHKQLGLFLFRPHETSNGGDSESGHSLPQCGLTEYHCGTCL
ncbi:hypothetical protein MAPG_08722, partial [Magnaporthiopsis poae ATCC 64411]